MIGSFVGGSEAMVGGGMSSVENCEVFAHSVECRVLLLFVPFLATPSDKEACRHSLSALSPAQPVFTLR